jgi:hypothetical protein
MQVFQSVGDEEFKNRRAEAVSAAWPRTMTCNSAYLTSAASYLPTLSSNNISSTEACVFVILE